MTQALDLSALRNAITSLAEGLAVVDDASWFDRQPKPVQNTLIAGVIQNFEFVYEMSVKMIKRRVIDAATFREALHISWENGLIENVEPWLRYRQMRGTTSHVYDCAKAEEVYGEVSDFLRDARKLLIALELATPGQLKHDLKT